MLFCRDDFTTFILIKYSTKSNISLSITLISSQISSHSDQLIVYIVEYSGCVQKFKVGTVRARRRVDLHDQDIITGRRASLSQHELSPHAAFDKYWQKISQISWILKLVDHLSELHLKWKLTNKEQKSLSSWQQILLIFHVSVVVFAMSTANFFCGLEMPSSLLCARAFKDRMAHRVKAKGGWRDDVQVVRERANVVSVSTPHANQRLTCVHTLCRRIF